MKRVSNISLVKIFTLLLAILSFTSVEAKQYRVTTTSSLNVRSAPTTNSEKIALISSGEIVNVIETVSDGWMKIELDGTTGYVYGQYLEAIPEPSPASKKSNNFWNRKNKFWTHFILFLILTVAFYILSEDHALIAILCNIGAAICVWQYTGYGDSFWFLDFEENGFFLYIGIVFLIFIFMTYAFTIFWEHLCMILAIFRDPITAIIGLTTAIFWFLAIKDLVFDILEYHTITALLVLFSSIPSSRQFVGTFTDRDGNKWDVYKE
jgi:hypothetical protein